MSARYKDEIKYGCRYSVLLDLPYYDPIAMHLIDPMHNLFLGSAKHFMFSILIAKNILKKEEIEKIKLRLSRAVVPAGLGRLPSSINIGTFLTAEQWKNWTIHFLIYCLYGLLPNDQLECWRHFCLACRRLCSYSITEDDLSVADALLLRFCKRVRHIYGIDALTPNMHMNCHLVSCIRDFGPIQSFWLFPFERYNGILGSQPTNNRSIEVQLMRRFQTDNMNQHLAADANNEPFFEYFSHLLEPLGSTVDSNGSGTANSTVLGSKYTTRPCKTVIPGMSDLQQQRTAEETPDKRTSRLQHLSDLQQQQIAAETDGESIPTAAHVRPTETTDSFRNT